MKKNRCSKNKQNKKKGWGATSIYKKKEKKEGRATYGPVHTYICDEQHTLYVVSSKEFRIFK